MLPESLLFIDDKPAERLIVTAQIPGVVAPEIGESHQCIQNIDRNGFFEATALSEDDLIRSEMYQKNAERARVRASFTDYEEYLASLEMKAVIRLFEPLCLERITQLTNKSNQFNLTTRRYTKVELSEFAKDPDYITLYGKLMDRFGDNGIVSVLIGHRVKDVCYIDLWLMSCRVLKRNLKLAMMDVLVHRCREEKILRLHGLYHPTGKNELVRDFYGLLGFEKVSEDETGNSEWRVSNDEFLGIPGYCSVRDADGVFDFHFGRVLSPGEVLLDSGRGNQIYQTCVGDTLTVVGEVAAVEKELNHAVINVTIWKEIGEKFLRGKLRVGVLHE